jgi:hypothetical protein
MTTLTKQGKQQFCKTSDSAKQSAKEFPEYESRELTNATQEKKSFKLCQA